MVGLVRSHEALWCSEAPRREGVGALRTALFPVPVLQQNNLNRIEICTLPTQVLEVARGVEILARRSELDHG